tara:strand:- start:972 stop:1751 length:780 start_codon:yes stop_codon:yes gene_type:complete
MTLIIDSGFNYDPDASAYIDAVEVADAQVLETATRYAINDFVIGCKQDGIWSAIKASCILAGARTLSGALVPLVGTAPTSFSFVSGDYNRKTGLVGNGSSKYLNSNRNNNADPQNNRHAAVYANPPDNSFKYLIGARTPGTDAGSTQLVHDNRTSCLNSADLLDAAGSLMPTNTLSFHGISRNNSSSYVSRVNSNNYTINRSSTTAVSQLLYIFNRQDLPATTYSSARLAFYSIGESLDLALLDARVTALINAFAAAIP